jgi:hypothetical protein
VNAVAAMVILFSMIPVYIAYRLSSEETVGAAGGRGASGTDEARTAVAEATAVP